MKHDVMINWDGGSIYLVRGHTEAGREWLEERLDSAGLTWGMDRVVEERYIEPILDGMQAAGLSVGITSPVWA